MGTCPHTYTHMNEDRLTNKYRRKGKNDRDANMVNEGAD